MTTEKIVYKVFDKINNKFICPNGKKSQWSSFTWAENALREVVKPECDHGHTLLRRNPDDFEIQSFKLVMIESWPGKEIYEAKERRTIEAKLARVRITETKEEIKKLVPNVELYNIHDMLRMGLFSEILSEKLKKLFNKISELEK